MVTIADLIRHRMHRAHGDARGFPDLPSHGHLKVHAFRNEVEDQTHVALVLGTCSPISRCQCAIPECLTGDVFGSMRCDCGCSSTPPWSGSPPKGEA
jgi:GTP cyclohydrolase II